MQLTVKIAVAIKLRLLFKIAVTIKLGSCSRARRAAETPGEACGKFPVRSPAPNFRLGLACGAVGPRMICGICGFLSCPQTN